MIETIHHKVEFCVVGGGLAGMCAALAAARRGVKTLIMHERPVFGGNASSEVRMWVCGSYYDRETGIVEELRLENLYRNTHPSYAVWDSILYEKMRFQDNLICLLNCSCLDAEMVDGKIKSVKGWQMTTQTFHTVEADFFADCSGDSILAPLTGAEFRIGREAKSEFGESLGQDEADKKTMGMSCIMQVRETDSPKKFIPPAWAHKYPTDESFPKRGHLIKWFLNFWYLEYGGDQDSIRDTEEIRDDLIKTAFGMWDHIKNCGDHQADNWILDWMGFLPGKRESRRYVGDHILNQHDVIDGGKFDDIVAFGGWPVDDHHPAGFRYFGPPNMVIEPGKSYGIPLRCLYSKNIPNLLFAGRNISATHTGLSSTRVMATCATLGQAVGSTVVCAVKGKCPDVRSAAQQYINEIQQILLDDDCYLLDVKRNVAALTTNAKLTVSAGDADVLRNGADRPVDDGAENAWHVKSGDWAEYETAPDELCREVRLIFDSNLKRNHLNMVANYPLKGEVYTPPVELVKAYHLEADGKEVFRTENNYQRLVKITLPVPARKIKLVIDALRDGCESARVFNFEIR